MTDTWWEYVQDVTRKAGPAEISETTQIPAPTISRWNPKSKGVPSRPDPDNVVRFARAYHRSPLEALIAADYINPEDIGVPIDPPGSMSDITDDAFMGELSARLAELRRLQRGNHTKGWSASRWAGKNPGVGLVQDGD